MTQNEYEQKKRECWEEFCYEHLFDPHNIVTQGIFGYAFDRAYALGKQEKDADTVIQGWVARTLYGNLWLYEDKPYRTDAGRWMGTTSNIYLPNKLFSDLTWSDEPQEVEIILKRKKNG